jgi:tRNA dimethylallyltransferase
VNYNNKLIVILGPTAVGKTKFASKLAYNFNGEIISADSRQVYIGMDVGTGKDYEDYIVDNQKIKAHLIDVVKPHCEFNLYLFTQLFKTNFHEIIDEEKLPFLVGGTGLYLSSIIQRYTLNKAEFNSKRAIELENLTADELKKIFLDLTPKLHNTTDLTEKERIIRAILISEQSEEEFEQIEEIEFLIIGLHEEREILKHRIRKRLKQRLQNGMIEEAEALLSSGITHDKLRFFGLEYKFLSLYLSGELNYNDMSQKLASAIIQFSKRQMTWYRKMEKEGVKIHWLKNNEIIQAEELITTFIN